MSGALPSDRALAVPAEPEVSALRASIPSAWVDWDPQNGEIPDVARVDVQFANGRQRRTHTSQLAWRNVSNPAEYRIARYRVVSWHSWTNEGRREAAARAANYYHRLRAGEAPDTARTFSDYVYPDEEDFALVDLLVAASGIEAATADKTPKSGLAEGESPVPEADAQ